MRLLPVTNCKPGMRLAKKIFSEEGLVLLSEGVELTNRLIQRLSEYGIQYVYIQDAKTEDIQVQSLISDETFHVALKGIRTTFNEMIAKPKQKKGETHPYIAGPFKEMMGLIIEDLSNHKDAMIMLMNMSIVDHYLYQHSLNVCVYTTLLGLSHGYSRDETMVLGLGALLHDVGKTQIDLDILKKPGKLTEDEYSKMQSHSFAGYQILKKEPNLPLLVAHSALQHHERLDGSGYPRGIKGNDIHEYAKWIGIVDSYDAMTTNRVYRRPLLPHEAVERLYAGSGTLYEQWMLQYFRDHVAIYPLGITVHLNTGEVGVVVKIHSGYPHRPVVRILYNEAGEELKVPYEIDLASQLTVMIVDVNNLNKSVTLVSGI
ncbi:HD-GYP domain-containing protein [Paenibacillus yanchengensis]|uniref:HD-GYP domain-containing protein n=1 Tax=Paenibacillus yanchengensis TaxID=2035833 RepID=A0ABW4YN55_9BACL